MSIIGHTLLTTVIFLFPIFDSEPLVYIRPPDPPREVREIVVSYAKLYGVDEQTALRIAECESRLDPKIIGDNGDSRGLWQIHRPSWPEITDEQAFDPEWSTRWAMGKMAQGDFHLWTCK